jgi:hypothetical protein
MNVDASIPLARQSPNGMLVGQSKVVSLPMNQGGIFNDRYFDPVYCSSLPLDWPEFSSVIEDINSASSAAFPKWQRALPCGMVAIGFIMFSLGGFLMVATAGFQGPSSFAIVVAVMGFFLFAAGGFGNVCCVAAGGANLVSSLRVKLSHLNAEYESKGVDFQLHESKQLALYHSTNFNDDHRRIGLRTVTQYTLVVQTLGVAGERSIPSPEVIMAQAFQGASAPPMQANMVEQP